MGPCAHTDGLKEKQLVKIESFKLFCSRIEITFQIEYNRQTIFNHREIRRLFQDSCELSMGTIISFRNLNRFYLSIFQRFPSNHFLFGSQPSALTLPHIAYLNYFQDSSSLKYYYIQLKFKYASKGTDKFLEWRNKVYDWKHRLRLGTRLVFISLLV